MVASSLLLLSSFLSALSTALLLVAVASPHWYFLNLFDPDNGYGAGAVSGLWQTCNGYGNSCKAWSGSDVPSWLNTVRAFSVIALLSSCVATLFTWGYTRVGSKGQQIAAIAALLATGT